MSARAVIDSLEFARAARELRGSVPLGGLVRLQEYLLADTARSVGFTLRGGRDDRGRLVLHIEINGLLDTQCQRCLEKMEFPLHLSNTLLLQHADMTEVEADDPAAPDCIEASPELDVTTLVEDEILLGMPYAFRHEDRICAQADRKVDTAGPRAFSKLATLKKT